ncbi:MAG TPA: type IV pili twitching motility protein PilT, partial [Deltaproteobacteria bacterium]|nr:type IV pili twitching motility protein PilT [Deltaproteobacteria bacterium]
MPKLDRLFKELTNRGASDLHLAVGLPIKLRIHGHLEVIRASPLQAQDAESLMRELVSAEQWDRFCKTHDLDFAYGIPGVVRLRANYFRHQGGVGAIFRVVPHEVLTCEQLNLPESVVKMVDFHHGLVLVTGPTGSGKSTTLAALIDAINQHQRKHIITIEEPIEFLHKDKKSMVIQREVGAHTGSFSRALRAAVRQDPDVILVGELRDRETMQQALEAAEMGFLVFGTLHTNSAAKTVDRVVDMFPVGRQPGTRLSLASSLRGVVAQLLLRTADGQGRVAVHEVLHTSTAAANIIREGTTAKLYSLIQSGRGQGMQTM